MKSKWMRVGGVFAVALSLVVAACDSVGESKLTGPSERNDALLTWQTSSGFTIAQETDPSVGVVTALIGSRGGLLNIGPHVLMVPAGAVDQPTTFVMYKFPGELKVGLTATRLLLNDVGRAGFKTPLFLSLSYADVAVPNERDLKIIWVKYDGSQVVLPTWIDAERDRVTSRLDHFSNYALGWPD